MLINNLESTWRRLCTHQLELGYKFTLATTQQLISTGWRWRRRKHSHAYFPNHFVPLNQPAWGAKCTLNDYSFIEKFIFHALHLQKDFLVPTQTWWTREREVFTKTISSRALQDWLHEKRFDSTIPCLRADLMCSAWEDGWNEKFNSFSSFRFDIVFAFFRFGGMFYFVSTMLYRCKVYHYLNIWSRIVCKCLHLFRERGWWGRLYKTRPDGFLPFNAKQDEEEEKLKLHLHPTFGNLPARKVYKLSLQISFFVRFKLIFQCTSRNGLEMESQ